MSAVFIRVFRSLFPLSSAIKNGAPFPHGGVGCSPSENVSIFNKYKIVRDGTDFFSCSIYVPKNNFKYSNIFFNGLALFRSPHFFRAFFFWVLKNYVKKGIGEILMHQNEENRFHLLLTEIARFSKTSFKFTSLMYDD